ncbi:hypothetical protein VTN31DRAFT_4774 [Thermomyces dupontii]|uniref:uncharacterized protein n=1 Tax=Talaromyces thermophilus TaxID=28565 RepID=UPI003742AD6E
MASRNDAATMTNAFHASLEGRHNISLRGARRPQTSHSTDALSNIAQKSSEWSDVQSTSRAASSSADDAQRDNARGNSPDRQDSPPDADVPRRSFASTITDEVVQDEVRSIYAGLVMVEKKCIQVVRDQSQSTAKLSDSQWQTLCALHRTLLNEHYDLFLAANHPAASATVRNFPEQASLPARMWRHGIHAPLELMRNRLPDSLEHMIMFVHAAYSMMTLLVENVPSLEATWLECLGDLARYGMAVEEKNAQNRGTWCSVSRSWYMQAADRNPGVGRLQHHLAVLSRPNILQQLFYYSKSLISIEPFTNARSSIQAVLFRPLLLPDGPPRIEHIPAPLVRFVTAHGILFTRGLMSAFLANARFFLQNLDSFIGQVGAHFRDQGAQISLISIASIFDFGQPDARIPKLFDEKVAEALSHSERAIKAQSYWQTAPPSQKAIERRNETRFDVNFKVTDQVVSYGSFLAFTTLRVILSQSGNGHILPAFHVYLAFLWTAALVPESMLYLQADVPWSRLCAKLNLALRLETDIEPLRRGDFPMGEVGTNKQLPEDFYIRGYSWSRLYYPSDFFTDMPDEESRYIEMPSFIITRARRCIWLGLRIAEMERWITYDAEAGGFAPTEYARNLESLGRQHIPATLDVVSL